MSVKNSSTHRVQMCTQAAVVVRYMDSGNPDRNCKAHHISEAFDLGAREWKQILSPQRGVLHGQTSAAVPERVPQQLCTQVTRGRPTARLCLA